MTKEEFSKIASAMQTYYPREDVMPNTQAKALWYDALGDLDYHVLVAALKKWVVTQKWMPSIAELRECAMDVMHGSVPDWGKAWEEVQDAIHRHGFYEYNAAMADLSESARIAVDRIGWDNICMSENHEATRANFRMAYESVQRETRERRQMPQKLLDVIDGIKGIEQKY